MPEWIMIGFRSIGAVVMLFLITRILGKKQISQLTFFEYVTGITLGELAGFISTDLEAHYFHGVISLAVWFVIPFFFEKWTLKNRTLRGWFEGRGRVLIKDGKVLEDNLKKERLSADELLEQLRGKNAFRVADVEFAVMESSGELSVLLKKENLPLTSKDLGVKQPREREPLTVIMDGEILDESLSEFGQSRGWLHTELEKQGLCVDNVFIGQVDAYNQLYLDLFDDKLKVPQIDARAVLYATLKKCAADLELYALSTQNKEIKSDYTRSAESLEVTLRQLKPLLKH